MAHGYEEIQSTKLEKGQEEAATLILRQKQVLINSYNLAKEIQLKHF